MPVAPDKIISAVRGSQYSSGTSTNNEAHITNIIRVSKGQQPISTPTSTPTTINVASQPSIFEKGGGLIAKAAQVPKTILQTIGGVISDNFNKATKGGIPAIKQRIKEKPPLEEAKKFWKPAVTYEINTVKTILNAIAGAGKLTQPYISYRAATGNPVKPNEHLKNILDSGLEILNTAWRVQPIAPTWGATANTVKKLRQMAQGKPITWEDLANAPTEGINEQPGFGEIFTDNVKYAQALDVLFLATMFATPFAKKRLNDLNLKSVELNQVSKTLGVKPSSTLKEVEMAFKKEIKKYPDTFTSNPNPANMAIREELTTAYNAFKKAGTIEKKYAQAYDFVQGLLKKAGIETKAPEVIEPKAIPAETGKVPEGVVETKAIEKPTTQASKGKVFTDFEGKKRLDTNTSWNDLTPKEQNKALNLMVKETGDKEVLGWSKNQIDKYMSEISGNWDRKTGKALEWIKPEFITQPTQARKGVEIKVYHGTSDVAKGGTSGHRTADVGQWFTSDKKVAKEFADWTSFGGNKGKPVVKEKTLTFKNPKVYKSNNEWDSWQLFRKDFDKYRTKTQFPNTYEPVTSLRVKDPETAFWKVLDKRNVSGVDDIYDVQGFVNDLKKQGYDGIILEDSLTDAVNNKPHTQYIKFRESPTQARKGVGKPKAPEKKVIKPKKKTVSVPQEQLPVGEGKEKASRLETRVKDVLDKTTQEVKEKLGIQTYKEMSKKSNIEAATKYVTENPNEALQVLRGEKPAPKGILRNSIYIAMQNQALGDVDLARKLASLQSTRYGQELSILTEIDPDSPVSIMADLVDFRRKAVEKKMKTTVDKAVKKEVDKIKKTTKKTSKWDWNEFIKSIEC